METGYTRLETCENPEKRYRVLDITLLNKLVTTPGISGREQPIREVIRQEMASLVDEVRTDALGNVIGIRRGGSPRIMFSAHMDSIGFMVSNIDDNGYLRVSPVGGFDPRSLVAQRVTVLGKRDYPGLMTASAKPLHLSTPEERNRAPKIEDIFIDLMIPAEDVKANVSVGDAVTLSREPLVTDRAYTAAYLDDRIGIYSLLEALRQVPKCESEIYAVITVQEEVGLRGARTSAFGVEPDAGVAIDVSVANDFPGGDSLDQNPKLGKGAGISMMDSSAICDPRLVAKFRELAESNDIPYQIEFTTRGGTDAGGMQQSRAGVPVSIISTPIRYIHSVNEMALLSDLEATTDLLAKFIESAHKLDLSW